MEAMIALDTHVIVWLHAGDLSIFPEAAKQRLASEPAIASPMAALELQYLHEIGRVRYPASEILADLSDEIGLELCDRPYLQTLKASLALEWTRDPFDRLIAAHALANDFDLITKDAFLLQHCEKAFWD